MKRSLEEHRSWVHYMCYYHPAVSRKNPPLHYQIERGAYKVHLDSHLCRLLQKSNTESWMYLPPFPPPLFFSSLSMDNEPCLVLGAWRTHKQSEWQVTGEAAPLVPIIPVKLLHCCHYTSISTGDLPCWRRTPLRFHSPSLSLAVLRAREVWQRQRVECPLVMNVRLAVKPYAQTIMRASYNERHLSKTEEGLSKNVFFSHNCLNPLMDNISNSEFWS